MHATPGLWPLATDLEQTYFLLRFQQFAFQSVVHRQARVALWRSVMVSTRWGAASAYLQ